MPKIPTSEEIAEDTEQLALKINKSIPEGKAHGVVLGALAVLIGTSIQATPDLADKSEMIDYVENVIRRLAFAPRINS